uniref:Putative AC9 transposase n=1 Tax=Zeugodacus cucurbitae TaxID=28588 RepID=A0A0A1WMC4_ZEUCU
MEMFCIAEIASVNGLSESCTQESYTSQNLLPLEDNSSPIHQLTANSNSEDSFFFPNLLLRASSNSTEAENVSDEIRRYSAENVEFSENFDVMQWWLNNNKRYPRLSKLAEKVLAIPASSAASERVFSLAGNIITEKRNRIAPKTVDSILFLNSIYNKQL